MVKLRHNRAPPQKIYLSQPQRCRVILMTLFHHQMTDGVNQSSNIAQVQNIEVSTNMTRIAAIPNIVTQDLMFTALALALILQADPPEVSLIIDLGIWLVHALLLLSQLHLTHFRRCIVGDGRHQGEYISVTVQSVRALKMYLAVDLVRHLGLVTRTECQNVEKAPCVILGAQTGTSCHIGTQLILFSPPSCLPVSISAGVEQIKLKVYADHHLPITLARSWTIPPDTKGMVRCILAQNSHVALRRFRENSKDNSPRNDLCLPRHLYIRRHSQQRLILISNHRKCKLYLNKDVENVLNKVHIIWKA